MRKTLNPIVLIARPTQTLLLLLLLCYFLQSNTCDVSTDLVLAR